jgi:hypothetical protein
LSWWSSLLRWSCWSWSTGLSWERTEGPERYERQERMASLNIPFDLISFHVLFKCNFFWT